MTAAIIVQRLTRFHRLFLLILWLGAYTLNP